MQKREYSVEVGGKKIIAEFNDLAEQANGSVLMRSGDTAVLVTAVMSKDEEDTDYLPLTVDYEERFYAVGKMLGSSFVRREGKPSDEAVLAGRIVDRTIRPLFDQRIRHDIQVVALVLALGKDAFPETLATIGASLALGASDIPWGGPVSAVHIAEGALSLVACGTTGLINMVEAGGMEIEEAVLVASLEHAQKEIEVLHKWQEKIIKEIGKSKRVIAFQNPPEELAELFHKHIEPKLGNAVFSGTPGHKTIDALKTEWLTLAAEKFTGETRALAFADAHFEHAVNNLLHHEAIENSRRADGRGVDEVRPLFAQAGGISPVLHGSGVFYRGGTHILSTLTLGGPKDAQILDALQTHGQKKHFMHHYNFPPFGTGETGKLGGKNRRMIGHGALAEKALIPVLPSPEIFPYTIRVVSEALSSNGSTSMGSVCASSLALMDGGVPITAPVAGIASGLMLSAAKSASGGMEYRYKILTDIQGPEDHHGDMDLKVAGTRKGVTAVQMDVKVDGVPNGILAEALQKARTARHYILDTMEKVLGAPRADIAPSAPKILVVRVRKEQVGLVIGSGGKTINEIKARTEVDAIDIEDDGRVFITGKNGSAEKAAAVIKHLIESARR